MKRTRARALTAKRKGALLLIAAAALIPSAMLARRLAVRSMPSVDPTVSIEPGQSAESSEMGTAASESSLPDDGEVYRTRSGPSSRSGARRSESSGTLPAVRVQRPASGTRAISRPSTPPARSGTGNGQD